MEKKLIRNILITFSISLFSYLFFSLRHYYSPENIEERCTIKFQKDVKKGVGKTDEEWGLNIDIANENYFKCHKTGEAYQTIGPYFVDQTLRGINITIFPFNSLSAPISAKI